VVSNLLRKMAVLMVKISSDVVHVFISGLSKEVKEKTTRKLINNGYLAEEQFQKSVLILMFLIRS